MGDSNFSDAVEIVGKAVDGAGVGVIVLGLLLATALFVAQIARRSDADESYRLYRQRVGKAILLGLEFLVAADIVRTVAVSPSFRGVGVLGVIVLVRTFLSFTLEVELEGRWPWQSDKSPTR